MRSPRTKGSRSGRMKACAICGTEFYCVPFHDRPGRFEKKYCSNKCRYAGITYTPWEALEAFWSYVDRSGDCWLWKMGTDKWGYGDLRWEGKHVQAHRLAWKLLRGDPGKMDCLHTCHNPSCCNPDHLYLGTDVENGRDRVVAGRSIRGAAVHTAKLTEDQVRQIRLLYVRTGFHKTNSAELSERFGVTRGTITQIMSGARWKHLQ